MGREEKVLEQLEKIIGEGRRPSVELLSQELEWPPEDVHSVVNSLEKKSKVESYVREVLGRKIRLLSLKR